MIREIRLHPTAATDLDDIWAYSISALSQTQAITYLNGLDATLRLLAEFPEMARLRHEFTPPVRIKPYREHLIVFQSNDDTLDVIRVLHGRTNWRELLAD